MERMIKDNFIYLLLVVLVIVGGIYLIVSNVGQVFNNVKTSIEVYKQYQTETKTLQQITEEKNRPKEQPKMVEINGDKRIYEVKGDQFTKEASFSLLFENVLSHAKESGIRIKEIQYNYNVGEDKIKSAGDPSINVCELVFTTVGTYTQFQKFFKGMFRETYLNNLAEVELKPWEKDKSILITKFRLRLYTKTI